MSVRCFFGIHKYVKILEVETIKGKLVEEQFRCKRCCKQKFSSYSISKTPLICEVCEEEYDKCRCNSC